MGHNETDYGSWLMGTQKSLSRPDFLLGLPLKTEILTPDLVTCKLLLLKRPIISQSFQFRFVCRIFFLPLKVN